MEHAQIYAESLKFDIFEILSDKELVHGSWQYLHGSLEDESGYDKFAWLDEQPKERGIYPVMVHLYNGKEPMKSIESLAFVWYDVYDHLRGLVVAIDDTHYLSDAIKKYNSNTETI